MSETKVLLTEEQVEDICSVIPLKKGIPPLIAKSIRDNIVETIIGDLRKIKIYPKMIPKLKSEIELEYHRTSVAAGEAVGIQMACAIGERATQQTLNSLDFSAVILYQLKNKNVKIEPIGEMVENLLHRWTDRVKFIEGAETSYLDTTGMGLAIPTTDENGKTSWKEIEAVTRHLPGGKLVKVKTESGRSVVASRGASFIVWDGVSFKPKNGSDIVIGDIIPATKNISAPETKITQKELLTDDYAVYLGYYLCELIDDPPVLSTKYKSRNIPEFIFSCEKSFIKKLLKVLIILKGEVCTENSKLFIGPFIPEVLHGVSFLLNYFGVFSMINDTEDYLSMDVQSIKVLMESILSPKNVVKDESELDVVFDTIISIEEVDSTNGWVYDFTVKDTRNFNIFNGLGLRDSFHSSGMSIKTVIKGVPRFTELLSATKNPKMVNCIIYTKEKCSNINELSEKYGKLLVGIKMKKMTLSHEIIPPNTPLEEWHNIFINLFPDRKYSLDSRIRFNLNLEMLYEYRITIKSIAKSIEKRFNDAIVLYTPESDGILDVFIDSTLYNKGTIDDIEYHLEEKILPILLDTNISGVEGINEIFYENRDDEWIITTEGSNLRELFALKDVDYVKTICNNMWEIYEVLGIEAAREFLIQEYTSVVSSDGTFVNSCHIELLVDVMVSAGTINSINRYGQKKMGGSAISKASFETSMDVFTNSAINGELENTNGASVSIMLGKLPKVGTGIVDLLVDVDALTATNNKPSIFKQKIKLKL